MVSERGWFSSYNNNIMRNTCTYVQRACAFDVYVASRLESYVNVWCCGAVALMAMPSALVNEWGRAVSAACGIGLGQAHFFISLSLAAAAVFFSFSSLLHGFLALRKGEKQHSGQINDNDNVMHWILCTCRERGAYFSVARSQDLNFSGGRRRWRRPMAAPCIWMCISYVKSYPARISSDRNSDGSVDDCRYTYWFLWHKDMYISYNSSFVYLVGPNVHTRICVLTHTHTHTSDKQMHVWCERALGTVGECSIFTEQDLCVIVPFFSVLCCYAMFCSTVACQLIVIFCSSSGPTVLLACYYWWCSLLLRMIVHPTP